MSKFLVTGSVIVNDIYQSDGSCAKGFLGGSIYAVNGILPYTDDVLFLSSAGKDFDKYFGDYFRKNGLRTDGVELCYEKTHYTKLEYLDTGEWSERSIYGKEYDELYNSDSSIKVEYILKHGGDDVLGIYFESAVDDKIWQDLDLIREKCPNAKIMAEIYTSDTKDPSLKDKVIDLIKKVDIYSLNGFEAMSLFGTNSEEDSIEAILDLNVPCFFRLGKKGSCMIQDGKVCFAKSSESEESVDSTGCGNCSTGAALYGFANGFDPLKTAIYANVAAGVNARQHGPFPEYTKEVKQWMVEKAEELYIKQKENM